jgi:hypothetical protein
MGRYILKTILLVVFLINLTGSFVFAQSIEDLGIDKEILRDGDELDIHAIIMNPTEEVIYLQYLIMHSGGIGPAISDAIEISPNTFEKIGIYKTIINEDFRNGDYSVLIRLTDEMQNNIYDSQNLTFIVEGLPEDFQFDIIFNKKIFLKDEKINLDYTSEVSSPEITATLTYPSGKSEDLEIPSTLELDEVGTYVVDVGASKEGYKTVQVSKQFGIIEQEANIKGKSSVAEVSEGKDTEAKEIRLWPWIVAAIIALAITFFIYMKIRNNY